MDNLFEIAELIYKKIRNTIDQDELVRLESWINLSEENKNLFKRLADPSLQLGKMDTYEQFNKEKVWSAIQDEVLESKSRKLNIARFVRIAAAILLPVFITASFLMIYLSRPAQPEMTNIDEFIGPGSSKAILVLADGGHMELEQEDSPSDFKQAGVDIRNENNSLKYDSKLNTGRSTKMVFNELKTPKGGGYKLILADGTEVWLNSGSSLRFPVNFSDTVRKVFLQGEAYFNVTHNGDPFIVNSGSMDIRVLGTSFNVMAYEDETELITTLIAGKVRIQLKDENGSVTLSRDLDPSDQAITRREGEDIEVSQVNPAQFTSWVEGKFEFENEDLESVLRRLARWYDFEFEFENAAAKDYHFSARISNTEKISSILGMLEMTTDVKFELRENTIVVI